MRRLLVGTIAALVATSGGPGWAADEAALAPRLAPTAFDGAPAAPGAASPSMLRGLRQLQAGALPEGTVLVGDEVPAPLEKGAAQTLAVRDFDGDGVEELLQIRGFATAPKLALTDGATGGQIWIRSLSTYQFAYRLVPDGGGTDDILLFISGTVQRIDAATGTQLWSRPMPAGDAVGYWGVLPGADGGDLIMGAWTFPYPQMIRLQLQWRSMATGATRGTYVIDGEGDYPSAALAGDLDGDGAGDLFTLTPTYAFSAFSGGVLTAIGGRGATEIWSAPVAIPVTDFSWLVSGTDVTGDGKGDAVILAEWLGADGGTPTEDIVTVVNGNGGDLSGIRPELSVTLQGFPSVLETPGDLNGDGGNDLVFSGAVYSSGDGSVKVLFEAIGKGGAMWTAAPGYQTPISDIGYAWWPTGGDADADGLEDAVVLLGNSSGPDVAVAVSKRNGATVWQRSGLGGTWVVPAYADLNGDGDDDATWANAYHPDPSSTRFDLEAFDGATVLWSHTRVLDSGANGWTFSVNGGSFGPEAGEDMVLELNMLGGARHFAEVLRGADGTVRWRTPAA